MQDVRRRDGALPLLQGRHDTQRHHHIRGTFLNPDDGRRYSYDASFNAAAPVAWKADLSDADGWNCKLAGALLDDTLSGPQLRSAITAAIATEMRTVLTQRTGPPAA